MTKIIPLILARLSEGLKSDLRVCAVAKRFLGGRAAATKCHSFFGREFVSIRVDQFHFARNDVRAILDCFDFYVSHGAH